MRKELAVENLSRFGHHPDPAIDYCAEVDVIEGLVADVRAGLESRKAVEDRIFRASMFKVGGDERAVMARRKLLAAENAVTQL